MKRIRSNSKTCAASTTKAHLGQLLGDVAFGSFVVADVPLEFVLPFLAFFHLGPGLGQLRLFRRQARLQRLGLEVASLGLGILRRPPTPGFQRLVQSTLQIRRRRVPFARLDLKPTSKLVSVGDLKAESETKLPLIFF